MATNSPIMNSSDVVEILRWCEQAAIEVVIDGGWGVDALLGTQTRPHEDLDIAIWHRDAIRIRALLEGRGFSEVPRDDSWECNFVMGDQSGRLVDIHSVTYDAAGAFVYGVAYPFESLHGTGSIDGHPVRCITPEWLVKFHTGYTLDANDYHDVSALCRRFGIELPAEYKRFESRSDD